MNFVKNCTTVNCTMYCFHITLSDLCQVNTCLNSHKLFYRISVEFVRVAMATSNSSPVVSGAASVVTAASLSGQGGGGGTPVRPPAMVSVGYSGFNSKLVF